MPTSITTKMFISFLWGLLISLALGGCQGLAPNNRVYRYFAYGSNVQPSTMRALRQIDPLGSSAAILPDFELRFDGSEKSRLEPSAAFVTPCEGKYVHGVVYDLTPQDFAKVGNTEGIPFMYRWQKCQVVPYMGDGERAGMGALEEKEASSVQAFTLVSPQLGDTNIPPSSSYLGIIKEGAKFWKFDKEYQQKLATIEEAKGLVIKEGISGLLLRAAEFATGTTNS